MPGRETKAMRLYRLLFSEFGRQGWWPTLDRQGNCIYHPNNYSIPVNETQRVQIAIGALLAQNTNWKNAAAALKNLYDAGSLSIRAISKMHHRRLAGSVRPSGYFNQKARRIKNFARYVCKKYSCSLEKMFGGKSVDALRYELLSLHGIGPETADSIVLYAAKKPSFVIDAYTFRINDHFNLHRLKSKSHEKRYAELKEYFEAGLPKSAAVYNEFHALIVDWGKRSQWKRPF